MPNRYRPRHWVEDPPEDYDPVVANAIRLRVNTQVAENRRQNLPVGRHHKEG